MEKQGGIYARYSPGRDRDQTSTIEAQVSMYREKAQREGIVIDDTHIYVDRDISGRTIQRKGFQAMLVAIESGDFSEILHAKDDKRLFRNEREAGSRRPNPCPFPTPSKTPQHLTPSETSSSKCLMPLKYKKNRRERTD